ncbi:PQQ-binding-like beta-propeller repeat protein [Streptomyces sp. NPDC050418]|uniref:outer membrane protein assembly factor BamB family protein n=1 Tax=Streptomyces sp. NPDC050418 TaxID=3365612 RepID=UPI003793DF3F
MSLRNSGLSDLRDTDPPRIGTYRLLARLRESAATLEYLARDDDGDTIALLVPHPGLAASSALRRKFRAEADLARRAAAPWTVQVRETGEDHLATAFRPSVTLGAAVSGYGPLPEHAVRILGAALAEALVRLHALVPTHRGLAPHTVLLAADGPRLAGFGPLAAATDLDEAAAGGHGGPRLTLGYLTPEQVALAAPEPASDVFMLGLLLVYAATGGNPFGSATPEALATADADLGDVPAGLRPLLARCLDKDPARRPTPDTVAADLAPGGAAALLREGWLPGPLVTELAEQAATVLTLETPETPEAGGEPLTGTLIEPKPAGQTAPAPANPPARRTVLAAAAGLVVGMGVGGGWALAAAPDAPTPARPTTRASRRPHTVPGTPPTALWHFKAPESVTSPLAWNDEALIVPAIGNTTSVDLKTGKVRWSKPLSCKWGPVVVGDDLLLTDDIGLTRFSARTGVVRDRDKTVAVTDLLAQDGGRVWLAGYTLDKGYDHLVCYDAVEREVVWRTKLPKDFVYKTAGDEVTGALGRKFLYVQRRVLTKPHDYLERGRMHFLAVDRDTGEPRWEQWFGKKSTKNYCWISPEGVLYGSGKWDFAAYDLKSLDEQWKYEDPDGLGSFSARAVLLEGASLYAVSGSGNTYRLKAADGTPRWSTDTGSPSAEYAALATGVNGAPLYRMSWDSAVALEPEDGTIRWEFRGVGDDVGTWQAYSGTEVVVFARETGQHFFALPVE